jgi:hypothetical protein
MAYFDAQIQTLAGTATDGEMDQFCTDGAKEIINILPPKLKEKCMQETTLNNSSPTLDLDAGASGEILHVTRLSADSGGVRLPCREVPSAYGELTGDSSSIYYASVTDPAYWISSSSDAPMLSVNPTPTLNQTAIVYHIKYPTVDVDGDDSIDNFPNEAEYLVVLYAAIKVLQNKMNEKSGDLPSDISELVLSSTSQSLPTFTAPSDITLPNIPVAPAMSEKNVSITGTAPIYTKPVFALDAKPSISDLSISSPSAPTAPTLNAVFYVNAENADASAASVSAASSSVISKADISGYAPTYVKNVVAPDFADADNWLNEEEDSELVTSRVQIISTQLQEYQANIQNELNEYNKENSIYQANVQAELAKHNSDLQTAINNANLDGQDKRQEASQTTDIDKFNKAQDQALELENKAKEMEALIQENNIKISKYSQEISSYQAQISKEVQVYQQNLQKEIQLWETNNSSGLQKYTQDMQNELNEFNDANVEYQAKLQKDLQDAQLAESKEGRDLQKYASELSSYQAEVGAKVQEFQIILQNDLEKFKSDMDKYNAEVAKINSDNQNKIGKYSQDMANYAAKIQKHSTDYQWIQGQYAQLKQDYNQGIQLLVAGGLPQPQQQQGER